MPVTGRPAPGTAMAGTGGAPAVAPGAAARPVESRAAAPDAGRGSVLPAVTWLIRVAALVLIGIDTLTPASPQDRTASAVTTVAYGLGAVLLALWGLLDARGGGRAARDTAVFPFLIGAMGVACGFACAYPHGASLLGLVVMAAVAAGSEAALPAGWSAAVGCVLAIEAGALVTGAGRGVVLGYPLLLLVALLAGHNRRAYRVRAEQNAALLARAEELRAEQRRTAVLDERARIAREIHDVLAHSLGALNIQIQTARALLAHHEPLRADGILATAQRLSSEGLAETRRAVQALRTDLPPLPEALTELAEGHRQQHRAPVALGVEGAAVPLPPELVLCLVRAAQESLTNAAKHAPGHPVELTLRYEDHDVTLTVRNPLGNAEPDTPAFATVDGGFGLTGMRERLLLIGGTLTAGPEAGRWTVTARAPR